MYAIELGHFSFSAWNGWLDTWQKCNNVRLATLSGEAADYDPAVVDNWRRHLQLICTAYRPKEIFNAVKTGLFYRAAPTLSMVMKGDESKGGKKLKD